MQFDTLDQWLDWQTSLHAKAIDLGLDRVQRVADAMGIERIAGRVVTVAGTNGKGSTVAAYENWLHRAGFEVASYTSPHLLRYNERVKHNGKEVGDTELCAAFGAVEAARGDTTLTYFEYGTLAALYLIQGWNPDFAILEVGLGGRLDAVNIIDADLVHLTPIGLDHQAWLGEDRDTIGAEKAGVLRPGQAVVLNDPEPPRTVLERIDALDCRCLRYMKDYYLSRDADARFTWHAADRELELDAVLPGAHQPMNLAGVVAGLSLLLPLDEYTSQQVREYFHGTRVPGRFEAVQSPLACRLFVDVGHNPDAAQALAASLERLRPEGGRIVVLLGMLADKKPADFVAGLADVVDAWWLTTLPGDRGLDAARLGERIGTVIEVEALFDNPAAALDHALSSLRNQDIMLVTGSFITVELLLRALPDSNPSSVNGSEH